MATPYFNPHHAAAGACWHCTRFVSMAYGGSAARCKLANGPRVQADPARGCSGFTREVGADDEPGPPTAVMARPVLLATTSAPAAVRWAP